MDHLADIAPFFAAAARDELLIKRCTNCGEPHYYPRTFCPFCLGETEWLPVSGKGRIYSFSVGERNGTPHAIAYVTLEEGPTMLTNLVDCDFASLAIDLEVKVVFAPSGEETAMPFFTVSRLAGALPRR